MQTRPHKEERFLYVVYPLIALSGALVMDMMLRLAESWESAPKVVKITARFGNAFAIFLFLILSVSRSMHEVIHFRAPLQLYRHLYHVELERHIQSRSVAHDEDRLERSLSLSSVVDMISSGIDVGLKIIFCIEF